MTFPSGSTREAVEVSYAYGFSADIRGGPYDRSRFLDPAFADRVRWQAGVGREVSLVAGQIFDNLADAVDEWNAQPAGTVGVIAILDSRTYDENLTGQHKIVVPEGSELLITAADWPEREIGGVKQ